MYRRKVTRSSRTVKAPAMPQTPPGVPEDGMHALRHAYASVLLDAGESIKALSDYLPGRLKAPPGT